MSLLQPLPRPDSLVLYKGRPARVLMVSDKLDIEMDGGQDKRVRPKDVVLLHPGPLKSLGELAPGDEGLLKEAWEILDGTEVTLKELAELAFDAYTPATAWAAWQFVAAGVWFEGTVEAIRPRSRALMEQEQAERAARAAAEQDWADLLARLGAGTMAPEDRPRLEEVERLALERSEHSRILKALGYPETPVSAHRLLVSVGYWPAAQNPWPGRIGVALTDPDLPVPVLDTALERLDLTHLNAWAIDDEGNQDPDDALSIDGERIWVHVADVAALVAPDSDLDREARARGANLYLPEGTSNMLPVGITTRLGLGLQPISPALSFGMHLGEDGTLTDIDIRPTLIHATRISYAQAEQRADEPDLAALGAVAARYRARRQADGALEIDLPEVSVRVVDDAVVIRPLERQGARALVMDLMLMAGEAAARWCQAREVPIPYAVQPPPERVEVARTMAAMFAFRRLFKPSRTVTAPERHSGLGLDLYTRATSPLRRYADLLVHQQIRASLAGAPPLGAEQIAARAGEADQGGGQLRRCERLSNQHWKLVYLARHPKWQGEAVVVELGERRCTVLIPEFAMEARIRARPELLLDQRIQIAVAEVGLAEQDCRFQVRD